MNQPQPTAERSPNPRRFLKLTGVGAGAAGLAGAGALAGANQAAAVSSGQSALTRPGVLHSLTDLNRMRSKVAAGAPPSTGGYDVFAADFFSSSSYVVAGGRATVTRGTSPESGQLRVLGFTGAMLGLWVQDLDGSGVHADFAYATYQEGHA
ncbi:hypothetical protein ABZ357_15910 [Streptomyces sp. NPDC005917]|uniref:beta-xylosidase family glycoside hydrolase n=1 Tax=unclassified Streptomyces TaxID=2593676 RepID=UPI0033C8FDFB